MTSLPERFDHFFPYFPTAHAQARSDCGDEVLRVGPELARHRRNSGTGCALHGSAPPGVHGADDPSPRIRDENRGAVRHPYGDHDIRIVAEDDVRLGCRPLGRIVPPGDGNLRAMYLLHEADGGRRSAEGVSHSLPLPGIASERQVTRREEMACDYVEWRTYEGRAYGR
jgi:hypothetical protein